MLFDWITLVVTAAMAFGVPTPTDPLAWMRPAKPVSFLPRQREVTNWRPEAVGNLDLPWGLAAQLRAGRDAAQVTRCVRLNNYWCIKRAGWAGEIAADRDGHVAFASAIEGADVAALLLRRYYVDYGRRSAFAIISHWAPAECGPAWVAVRRARRSVRVAAAADHLATHGLANTLRARFLASRGHRVGGRARGRPRRSIVPDHLITAMRAPAIAVGMGEREIKLPALPLSGLTLSALGSAPAARAPAAPAVSCAGDARRIRNYATKTAMGVAASADQDLKLFTPDGVPTANLARVMHNMSAVEIGPLGAGENLIALAVEHARLRAQAEAAKPAGVAPAASATNPQAVH